MFLSSLPGGLFFYSQSGGGTLADTGFPTSFFANVVTQVEVGGGTTYTPIAGEPGFVSRAAGPVT
jgi:hypothetical protein